MFDIRLMCHDGKRLDADEMAKQLAHTGDFVLDQTMGRRRDGCTTMKLGTRCLRAPLASVWYRTVIAKRRS